MVKRSEMAGLSLPQPGIAEDYAEQRHALEESCLHAPFDRVVSLRLDELLRLEEFFK